MSTTICLWNYANALINGVDDETYDGMTMLCIFWLLHDGYHDYPFVPPMNVIEGYAHAIYNSGHTFTQVPEILESYYVSNSDSDYESDDDY
jgi:hypothetical protein